MKMTTKPLLSVLIAIAISQTCKPYTLTSIQDLLHKNLIHYEKLEDAYSFEMNRFPLSIGDDIQPFQGIFPEMFALSIPGGRIHSPNGWITINNYVMKELFWCHNASYIQYIDEVPEDRLQKYPGRVLALAQLAAYSNYYHFLYEIMGRLSLVDFHNIEYDWIYVPYHLPFMKELLQLWGINESKIIPTNSKNYYIEAEELIVPCMIVNTSFEPEPNFGGYLRKNILENLKKRLTEATDHMVTNRSFNDKVFISRKGSKRHVVNEDDVFSFFEKKGFTRYILDELSVVEQIKLFQQATTIVAIHGAGCCNMMFCQPNVRFIELFQARPDATFSNMASVLHIDYTAVQTSDFITTPTLTFVPTKMPLFIIEKIANSL